MRRLNAQKGILFAALTAVLFSMLEPVSKLVANSVSPFVITVIRFIAGALFLAPFALAEQKKHPRPLRRKEYAMVFLTGIIMVCISMPLLQLSIHGENLKINTAFGISINKTNNYNIIQASSGNTNVVQTGKIKDRKSTRLNSSHSGESRMPSSA